MSEINWDDDDDDDDNDDENFNTRQLIHEFPDRGF